MKKWWPLVAVLMLAAGLSEAQTRAGAKPTATKPSATSPAKPSTMRPASAKPAAKTQGRLDGVAAVVGGEPIFDSEVDEQLYLFFMQSGTRPDSASQLAVRKDILDRLVDEKLIVQEARRKQVAVVDSELSREGITENDLRERYRGEIRRQLLANQLLRKELNLKLEISPAEAEAYFKTNPADFPKRPEELGLAVIQISIGPESSAVVAARKRAEDALARLRKGESFTRLAQEVSEDPGTRPAGGDLGFFAHGDLDSTFEQAAFALKPGETSGIVRTSFGFHIIRVEERDTTRKEVHARHILIRVAPQASDQQRAETLAKRVYDEAKRGADFGDLVRRYSTYKGPAGPGGNLGFLPLSAFPQEFRDGLSALSVGQVSRPLLGPQGYNIFKMLDRHPERAYTFDEVKEQLPDLVRQIKLKKQYDTWVASLRSKAHVEYK